MFINCGYILFWRMGFKVREVQCIPIRRLHHHLFCCYPMWEIHKTTCSVNHTNAYAPSSSKGVFYKYTSIRIMFTYLQMQHCLKHLFTFLLVANIYTINILTFTKNLLYAVLHYLKEIETTVKWQNLVTVPTNEKKIEQICIPKY